jgi:8-hydroxy-5-deazaflavin:NADPH oxidoreductase
MIIAVVGGSGAVGSALASRLAAAGHQIIVAAREPDSPRVVAAVGRIAAVVPAASKLPPPSSAAIHQACGIADAILISVPGMPTAEGMADIAAQMGPCSEKPLIDCTNPLSPWPKVEINADRNTTSATEEFAKVFPTCG